MEIYKLSKPIMFDGEEVTRLEMDFDNLTSKDLENAEKEARALLGRRENMPIPETNKKYLACVAAKAAKVPIDLILKTYARDYTGIALRAQDFLLLGDSDSEDEDGETRENL